MFQYDNYDNSTTNILKILAENNVKVTRDTVIVEPIDDMTERGFHIVGKHGESDVVTQTCRGIVRAVGDGHVSYWGVKIKPEVKVGDKVILDRGRMMREKCGDGYVYILREQDILAVEEE